MEEEKHISDFITYRDGNRMLLDGVSCWLIKYTEDGNEVVLSLGNCKVEFVRSPKAVLHIPLKNLDKSLLAQFFLETVKLVVCAGKDVFEEYVIIDGLSRVNSIKMIALFTWEHYKEKFNPNELLNKLDEYEKERLSSN